MVYGKSRNEVLRLRAKAMTAARGSLDSLHMTVDALLREWLDEHVRKQNSPSTYRQRETIVRCHILPRLKTASGNPIKLRDLDPNGVRTLLARMEADRVGAATRHSVFAALHAALTYALQHDYVISNVCERVQKPKTDSKKRIVILSWDELLRLLRIARQDRFFPLVLIATQIGARRGELFALTWGCIDFTGKTIPSVPHSLRMRTVRCMRRQRKRKSRSARSSCPIWR